MAARTIGTQGAAHDAAQAVQANSGMTVIHRDGEKPSTPIPADQLLTAQRKKLQQQHEAVVKSMTDALGHAMAAGEILLDAKASLAHGLFREWVESQGDTAFPLSLRTAQRYMQVARNREQIGESSREQANATHESESGSKRGLSIREAIRLVAQQDGPKSSAITAAKSASSRNGHNLLTPWPLVEAVQQCLGTIDLDPCGSAQEPDHVGARLVWTETEDGLAADKAWYGRVFVHPPQHNRQQWVERSLSEINRGNAQSLLLLVPAVSDDTVFNKLSGYPRLFISSRVDGFKSPAVVFALGEVDLSAFAGAFAEHGDLYVPFDLRQA